MIALSPVLFGSGIRLFEGVDAGRVALELVRAEPTQRVTHLDLASSGSGNCHQGPRPRLRNIKLPAASATSAAIATQ